MLALLAAPLATEAQPPGKVYRIGILGRRRQDECRQPRGLPTRAPDTRVRGREEFAIEYRSAEGRTNGSPPGGGAGPPEGGHHRGEGTPAELAAKNAIGYNPHRHTGGRRRRRAGLVTSIPRPGGNITGLATFSRRPNAKRVELLKEPCRRHADRRPHEHGTTRQRASVERWRPVRSLKVELQHGRRAGARRILGPAFRCARGRIDGVSW